MTLIIVICVAAALLIVWAARSGSKNEDNARAQRAADAEQRRLEGTNPDYGLMKRARFVGVQLDIPADHVAVQGQVGGRFTGSLMRVETEGQLSQRVTLTRVALLGIFALAAQKQTDQRDVYISVEGDGFQVIVRAPGNMGPAARELMARYNTRSGALMSAPAVAQPQDRRP